MVWDADKQNAAARLRYKKNKDIDKEKRNARQRELYRKNKEARERILASNAAFRNRPEYEEYRKKYMDDWYSRNRERMKKTAKERNERLYTDPIGSWESIIRTIKQRAKRKGVPFNLTKEYLASIAPTHCPVLGVKLERRKGVNGKMSEVSPSVDRIVPALGYVVGNVLVVSQLANSIKNSATPEQIRKVAEFYENLLTTST